MNKNKNIYGLVTGAAGLLGIEHCKSVLDSGNGLIMIDINSSKLKNKFNFLKKKYPNSQIKKYLMDITSEINIKKLIKYLNKENIFTKILINNACIDPKPTKKNNKVVNLKSWDLEFNVGLKAPYLLIEYLSKQMIREKSGCIINISSDLSIIAPNQSIYKSSYKNFVKPVTYSIIKHGLVGMTKYYAALYASHGITCNAISPVGIFNNQDKRFVKELKKLIPMNRMAEKSDIKNVIDFLINKKQKFITGQNIVIDGGRTII